MLDALRRHRLARQRSWATLDEVARGQVGLHSTDYASPWVSARVRLGHLDVAGYFERLQRGDGLVRINAHRNTLHLVVAEDVPLLLGVHGPRLVRQTLRQPPMHGQPEAALWATVDRMVEVAADGPVDMRALKAAIPELGDRHRFYLFLALGSGRLVRATAAHARSNRTTYAPLSTWLGGEVEPLPEAEAQRELVARHVSAYGPVCVDDISWWVPCAKRDARRALEDLGDRVVRVDGEGRTWWVAPEHLDAPAAEPPRVLLLPYEDPLAKCCIERGWYLSEAMLPWLFPHRLTEGWPPDGAQPDRSPRKTMSQGGEIRPSIWVDGRAVGRWELHGKGANLSVVHAVHAAVDPEALALVEAELGALDSWVRGVLGPACQ